MIIDTRQTYKIQNRSNTFLVECVSFPGEVWKPVNIEGFQHYLFSNLGRIKKYKERVHREPFRGYVLCHPWELGETGYFILKFKIENKGWNNLLIHRLICLAFNPIPINLQKTEGINFIDGVPYIVNHKDGNKANNKSDNLEWCTSKENNDHAVDNNLSNSISRITVYDSESDLTYELKSINQVADFLKVSVKIVYSLIFHYKEKLYKGRFRFRILDEDKMHVREHPLFTEVIFKDYRTGQISIASSYSKAAYMTGVSPAWMSTYIRIRRFSNPDRLYNGFVFRPLNDCDYPWPDYQQQEIDESISKFKLP